MKVTFNLPFLLCIGTIAMSAVEASLNDGLGSERSAATKPSLQRQDVFDFAAQQSNRGLKSATATALLSKRSSATKRAAKTQKAVEVAIRQQRRSLQTEDELDAISLTLCEVFLEALLGPNSGCTCTEEEPSMECNDFIYTNCLLCDTIQFEEACLVFDEEAVLAASTGTESLVDCLTYKSGPFADDTISGIENLVDNTCTFTINETECNSCTVVACDGEETDFDIDCSNIIAGETWNICTDDIPETSLFIAFGTNDLFQDLTCGDGGGVDIGPDSVGLAVCQTFVDGEFGVDSGCVCEFDGKDFLPSCECVFKACDTLQGVEACLLVDEDAQLEAEARNGVDNISADCFTYKSGPFADSTICLIEASADSNTCTITINGKECNSCNVVTCSDTDGIGIFDESYDMDCSNIIAGETWNLCSDDIPDTSPFIAVGNNMLFSNLSCVSAADNDDPEDVNPEVGESDGSNPGDESLGGKDSGDGGDMSGGIAASSHVLSLVGLIIVPYFW
jgi:hypothetical protein